MVLACLIGGAAGLLTPTLAATLLGGRLRLALRDWCRFPTVVLGVAWGWVCGLAFPVEMVGPMPGPLASLAALPMLTIALIDLRARVIHDVATLGLALCLFAWRWSLEGTPWAAVIGGGVAFLGAEALRRGYRRLRRREGLGTGDVGVIAAAGVALDPATLAPFLIVAGLGGLSWGAVAALVLPGAGGTRGFSFAPALIMALSLALLLASPRQEVVGVFLP